MAKAAYSIVLWLNVPGPQAHEREEKEYLSQGGGAGASEHEATVTSRTHVFNAPAASRLIYGSYETHAEAISALNELESHLARDQAVHIGDKHDERGTLYLVPAKSVYYAVLAATHQGE